MTNEAPNPDTDLAYLCRAYRPQLVTYAARWTRHRHDAEDAVQDAFLFAIDAYPITRPDNPRAWLYAVVRRRALAVAHGYSLTVPVGDTIEAHPEPEPATPQSDSTPSMADPDTALYVLAALDLLSPRRREALQLWALDGFTWAEVAERMGITRASARHTGYTSLRKLRTT